MQRAEGQTRVLVGGANTRAAAAVVRGVVRHGATWWVGRLVAGLHLCVDAEIFWEQGHFQQFPWYFLSELQLFSHLCGLGAAPALL